MPRWIEQAPAKLNLTLDILGRRDDGYHDLRMVMQTVSLADTVIVEPAAEGFVLCVEGEQPGDFLPAGKKTLEQRAAEAFFAFIGQPLPPLRLTLRKAIPAYAGIGGGSADVAALLRLLRRAYCPSLSGAELETIGLGVGSDVPFCVRGGTALAEGRGERLTDLPPLPDCFFVLCKPDFRVPTPELFALADRMDTRGGPDTAGMVDTAGMMDALRRGDLSGAAERFGNVFETVFARALPEKYEEIRAVKRRLLQAGALNASMSGSGPTVFGLFRAEAAAQSAAAELRRDYRETFTARPVGKRADIQSRFPLPFSGEGDRG